MRWPFVEDTGGEEEGGEVVTVALPTLRIRSFGCESTGDHSISSWDGGGSSVITLGGG